MLKRNKVLISGRVQGVFFRRFISQKAKELNLTGYVKNLDSGEVEAEFQGEKEKIEKILEFCKIGPKNSKVERIIVKKQEAKEESSFKSLS